MNSALVVDSSSFLLNEKAGPGKKDGSRYTIFNYINCIVGSGVVGIPYALSQAGFGAGLMLLLAMALITDYSLRLMVRCAYLSNSYTYQALMRAAYGPLGFFFLSAIQFIYPFTAMVSYNIMVGDTLTKVIVRLLSLDSDSLLARRDLIVAIATLTITTPLCLLKDLVALTRASALSLVLIIYILATVFYRMTQLTQIMPLTADTYNLFNSNIFSAFGIMAFAFMCHHNVFLLHESMENPDQKKWNRVTHFSVAISFLILALFGIAGYLTFTQFTQSDLFENYCWKDDLMNVSRLAFALTVLIAFPIECMTARSVLYTLFQLSPSTTLHLTFTLFLVMTTYLTSITTTCLGFVLELNGMLSAIPLAFVMPALIYLKLEEGAFYSWTKLPAFALVLFGLGSAFIGSILLFSNLASYLDCSTSQQSFYCNV